MVAVAYFSSFSCIKLILGNTTQLEYFAINALLITNVMHTDIGDPYVSNLALKETF